ncbi:MAG TPA: 16S rRNA (cytidine(1402)-2'-O)-methyltransferase [Actinomycetota bacterium]
MDGTLFVVGTPIGNLADLTERARETLAAVELVAAEDTRRTGRLLQAIGVRSRLLSVHDANEAGRVDEILAALREGCDVALVSDGGMPLVSDPGYRVVRAAAEAGLPVRVVPGPSAALAALVVSGLPTDRFAFEGFLPRRGGERRARLEALATDPRTIVFFESPVRVAATLADLRDAFGADRPAAVCRELTKLHEETRRGSLGDLAAGLAGATVKGEVAVVVGGSPPPAGDLDGALAQARAQVAAGTRPREAAKAAASAHGVRANDVYARLRDERS